MLLALPMKFSAKQVYLPSSDRLMFLMIKVPSGGLKMGEAGRGGGGTMRKISGFHSTLL